MHFLKSHPMLEGEDIVLNGTNPTPQQTPVQPATNTPWGNQAFEQPVTQVVQQAIEAVPFNDPQSLLAWATKTYQSLPGDKQAKFQGVVQSMGVQNLTMVPKEQYQAFYNAVKAL